MSSKFVRIIRLIDVTFIAIANRTTE